MPPPNLASGFFAIKAVSISLMVMGISPLVDDRVAFIGVILSSKPFSLMFSTRYLNAFG
ncbi:MAG: hypothetical protein QW389_07630 [Desulfurococcus sp.]